METIEKIIGYLLKFLSLSSKRARAKNQRIIDYLDECTKHFTIIISHEKYSQVELEVSHKWLKHAHLDLLRNLGNLLTAQELDILRQSLMSGRIYYHAVRYSKVSDDQILDDYKGRLQRYIENVYDQREFRHNSNERILKDLVKYGKPIPEKEREYILSKVKTVCIEDLARIYAFKERLKTRHIYIIDAN